MGTPTAAPVPAKTFLSWASRDARAKDDLVGRLTPHLEFMRGIDFEWWEMSDIQIGKKWRADILQRIDECDAGMLLMSPAAMASPFIREHEIPPFFGPNARTMGLPVGLRRVSFDQGAYDLLGVPENQVFLHKDKFFTELDSRGKDAFAFELAEQLRMRFLDLPEWRRA